MVKRLACWVVFGAILGCSLTVSAVYADTPKSAHYQFEEGTIGNTSLVDSSSPNYQVSGVAGSAAIGHSASTSYQANVGPKTTGNPALSFIINTDTSNFGNFSPTTAATATAQFTVVDYTSYGYIVQIIGNAPTYKNHSISVMSAPGSSTPGTEQFGINLVKNTNFCGPGCNVGADPNYGQFGATTAKPTADYDTANQFYYSSGDTIVESPKSSGAITYTIAFMVNVGSLTPAGGYTSHQQIICTGTY